MSKILQALWQCRSVEERIEIYRELGVSIGFDCFIDYGVWIEPGVPWAVEIKNNVVIAHGAKILGHDSALNNIFDYPIIVRKTVLNENCYIGTGAIIMPGVIIGEYAIVGAGAVVTKSVEAGAVVVGNPAIKIASVYDLYNKYESEQDKSLWIHKISDYSKKEQYAIKAENLSVRVCAKSKEIETSLDVVSIVKVSVVNDSNQMLTSLEPYPIHLSYRIFDLNGNALPIEGVRTKLWPFLLPQSSFEYDVVISGFLSKGQYEVRFSLVQENVCWFKIDDELRLNSIKVTVI